MYCGKWKIIDLIGPDFALPSSYSGFLEDGTFRGKDHTTILGTEITFTEDYAEYLGERHYFVYGPITYSHPLFSEDDHVGYYYAKTLGLNGDYYSVVHFALPDSYLAKRPDSNKLHQYYVEDFTYLYLKDNDTMYAADDALLFLLERIPTDTP
jgi:hypothetical protein